MFAHIGIAVSFSPNGEALLAEAVRLQRQCKARLSIIHIGSPKPENETRMKALCSATGLEYSSIRVIWEVGQPAKTILRICERESIDLLIAGALKKEKALQYYLGTIARKILHKANCSVLMLVNPQPVRPRYANIVVNAEEDSPYTFQALTAACQIGQAEGANWLHVVRELRLMGLLTATEQFTEEEYEKKKQELVRNEISEVQQVLDRIPHAGVRVNIKLVSGKSGYELLQFAQRKKAELLVVGAPGRRFSFLDRVFPNDLEYIFADLPCNVLVIHAKKETP